MTRYDWRPAINPMHWQVEKIEPTQATVALTLPEHAPLGPMSLWLTTSTGVVKPHTFFVDDLDAVNDSGNNHSIETAQQLSTRSTVEGVCDASVSDFYRIHATAGERIAVEVHTQQLRSAMDPVLRVLNAAGETLIQADDTSVGPDCRFSYEFAEEGDYWLEIHDSRNSAGGAPYQLRIGDFPIVNQCYPLAVRSGEKTTVAFTGPDGERLPSREIDVPAEAQGTIPVRARFDDGQSSSWVPLYCSSHPQFNETAVDSIASRCRLVSTAVWGNRKKSTAISSAVLKGKSFASLRKREALAVPRSCKCSCSTLPELRSRRPKSPTLTSGALMRHCPKTVTIDWRRLIY